MFTTPPLLILVMAAGLSFALYRHVRTTRGNEPMSAIEIKGLTQAVHRAKAAIRRASDSSMRMSDNAVQLDGTVAQVEKMADDIEKANAELQGALATMTNGGDPLDYADIGPSSSEASVSGSATATQANSADAATKIVSAANK